jgi:uncharacterized protein (TIRG00374 family)
MSLNHVSLPLDISAESGTFFSIVLVAVFIIAIIFIYRYLERKHTGSDLMNVIFQSKPARWVLPIKFRSFLMNQSLTILHQFRTDLEALMKTKKIVLLQNLMLSAIKWNLRYGVLPFILYFGFNLNVDYYLIFLLQGLIFFGSFLIMTPGGSGGAEIAYSIVFKSIIPIHIIGVSLLIWRFYTFYLQIIIGGIIVSVSMGKEGIRTLLDMLMRKSRDNNKS